MNETAKDPEDLEILAAAEHESWSGWTMYMLERTNRELLERARDDEELVKFHELFNGLPCVKRWTRQMNTTYSDLPEEEKESDRTEARKKLKVYRA